MPDQLTNLVTGVCDLEQELKRQRRAVLELLWEHKDERFIKVDWAALRKEYDAGRDR